MKLTLLTSLVLAVSSASALRGAKSRALTNIQTSYFTPFIPEAEALVAKEHQLAETDKGGASKWWFEEAGGDPPRTGDEAVDESLLNLELLMGRAEETYQMTDAMQRSINEMHKEMFKQQTAGQLAAGYATSATAVAKAVFGAMDKLQSGDKTQIMIGSMEIVGAVGKLVPGMGPFFELGAVIFGGILGLNRQSEETTESIVERVVKEALADARDKELQDKFVGLLEKMTNDNVYLENQLLVHPSTRTEAETTNLKSRLTNGNYGYNSGVEFMGELQSYIQRDLTTTNDNDGDRVAGQILAFVNLQALRERQMAALSLLWATLGDTQEMPIMYKVIESEHQRTAVRLQLLAQVPFANEAGHGNVLAALHSQLTSGEITQVKSFMSEELDSPVPGVLRRMIPSGTSYKINGESKQACVFYDEKKVTGGVGGFVTGVHECGAASSLFLVYPIGSQIDMLSIGARGWMTSKQSSTNKILYMSKDTNYNGRGYYFPERYGRILDAGMQYLWVHSQTLGNHVIGEAASCDWNECTGSWIFHDESGKQVGFGK